MKTAVQEFRRQLALNHTLIQDSEKVSIMISLSKFEQLFNEAKEMEKQQIINAFSTGYNYCYERELECQNDDFEIDYYNETYNND